MGVDSVKSPQTITTCLYGRAKSYPWFALDSKKADYNAEWGLRGPGGTTYLLVPYDGYSGWTHRMIAIGQFSGLYNVETGEGWQSIADDILSILKGHPGNLDIDRRIKKEVFESWKVTPPL
jgi:hypothetical protein